MIFSTPCFVRVKDAQKRIELVAWLDSLGYMVQIKACPKIHDIIIASICHVKTSLGFMDRRYIDCGENIELFKALAAMTDYNDREQWFVAHAVIRFNRLEDTVLTETGERLIMARNWFKVLIPQASDIRAKWMAAVTPKQLCHKATKDEIIEHFNRQKP